MKNKSQKAKSSDCMVIYYDSGTTVFRAEYFKVPTL